MAAKTWQANRRAEMGDCYDFALRALNLFLEGPRRFGFDAFVALQLVELILEGWLAPVFCF